MTRVLQVLGTTGLGGAESRVMDLYRHMDRNSLQFDFLVTRGTKGYYEQEIESLGGKIYYLPPFRVYNYFSYRRACKAFFKEHKGEYAAVHGHMTSTAAIYLPIAKKAGVPLTIAHARSAGVDPGLKGKITRFMRRNLYKKCDRLLSCSNEASISAFGAKKNEDGTCSAHGKEVTFMPNAIDSASFSYDVKTREELREQFGLSDRIVVGHVGSFRYAKNHEWIIKVFSRARELTKKDMVLMLLGDGELKEAVEEVVEKLGLSNSVIFTGNVTPVAPYYQMFDVLLFPSRYEGMPGTVVEAEAAGLPSLISDRITSQVGITKLVKYMSLDDSVDAWANELIRMAEADNDRTLVQTFDGKNLNETLYDVNRQVEYYRELYGCLAD